MGTLLSFFKNQRAIIEQLGHNALPFKLCCKLLGLEQGHIHQSQAVVMYLIFFAYIHTKTITGDPRKVFFAKELAKAFEKLVNVPQVVVWWTI